MLTFIKKLRVLLASLSLLVIGFSSCLKLENAELSPNPLEVLNDTQVTLFKLDSVVMAPTFAGYRDVNIYYTNSHKTFTTETQKRIGGVALNNGRQEIITDTNQKVFVTREQLIGTVLTVSFAFTLNSQKERSRLTTFQITVK